MTESGVAEQSRDDDRALKKRLLMRVAAAATVMAGLVVGLLIFDALTVKTERPTAVEAVRPAEPVSNAEVAKDEPGKADADKTAAAQEDAAKEPAAEAAVVPPPPQVAAVPEESAAPLGVPPTKADRPLTLPARPQMALSRPSAPVMILPTPTQVAKEPATAAKSAPSAHAKPEPVKPEATKAETAKPNEVLPAVGLALAAARRFLVQVGVFSNLANAEELRAKLELAGIPAQIEARVQVGPFASREEAEQARAKLRELGVEPGMVMAARK